MLEPRSKRLDAFGLQYNLMHLTAEKRGIASGPVSGRRNSPGHSPRNQEVTPFHRPMPPLQGLKPPIQHHAGLRPELSCCRLSGRRATMRQHLHNVAVAAAAKLALLPSGARPTIPPPTVSVRPLIYLVCDLLFSSEPSTVHRRIAPPHSIKTTFALPLRVTRTSRPATFGAHGGC